MKEKSRSQPLERTGAKGIQMLKAISQKRKLKLLPQLEHKGERGVSPVLVSAATDQSNRYCQ